MNETIEEIIKKYIPYEKEIISHDIEENTNEEERLKIAEDLLNKYSLARLVLTSRLHASLPCLGMKTPVILANTVYDKRFDVIYELLYVIGYNKNKSFVKRVLFDINGLVVNPENYEKYASNLILKAKRFIDN